jgi:hypothetical protein
VPKKPLTHSRRLSIAAKLFERANARGPTREEWEAAHQGLAPPSRSDLLYFSLHLIENPHRIGGPYDWELRHLLQEFVAHHPWPRLTSKEVAEMVDRLIDNGMSLSQARKSVADRLKKEPQAVKEAHLRNRRTDRNKSR